MSELTELRELERQEQDAQLTAERELRERAEADAKVFETDAHTLEAIRELLGVNYRNIYETVETLVENERELEQRKERAEAESRFYRERESDICKALPGLADGGKYRADIISRIGCLIEDKERAEADVVALRADNATLADAIHLGCIQCGMASEGDCNENCPSLGILSQPHPGDELLEELGRLRSAHFRGGDCDNFLEDCVGCDYRKCHDHQMLKGMAKYAEERDQAQTEAKGYRGVLGQIATHPYYERLKEELFAADLPWPPAGGSPTAQAYVSVVDTAKQALNAGKE
jgi:hypothetical protein